jgi:hypothetical protein
MLSSTCGDNTDNGEEKSCKNLRPIAKYAAKYLLI